jgi:hypothetical protein
MAGVPPAQLGSLWSTLEDQRGGRGDVPLLSSTWSLPGGEGAKEPEPKGMLRRAGAAVAGAWGAVCEAAAEMWAFARADRRRPVFAAKVGLALALISLLVFLREPRAIASHSVWAILTVVVVFEFSIGTLGSPPLLSLSFSSSFNSSFVPGFASICVCTVPYLVR